MISHQNPDLLNRAREPRREMTPQEQKLWNLFLKDHPAVIYRQRVIGSYIADFYCARAKLVIELDGSQHYEERGQRYDTERDEYLKSLGIKTLRFSNREINREFQAVCEVIDRELRERSRQAGNSRMPNEVR